MHIRSSINNNGNNGYDEKTDLPANKFSTVKVTQVPREGVYHFEIYLDGKRIYTTVNNNPADYRNVKVYMADPFTTPANAIVNDLSYKSWPPTAQEGLLKFCFYF